jgi:TonB family protein
MTQTADNLRPFVATSAVLHLGLFALVVFGPALFPKGPETSWGNSLSRDGTPVGVVPNLPGIRLPSPAVMRDNVKPSDTKTLHPAEVSAKPQIKTPTKSAEVKIPEKGSNKPAKPEPVSSQTTKAAAIPPEVATNAIPGGNDGQIKLRYGQEGTGPASFGGDGTFGTRFPGYVTDMTRAIEAKWQRPARNTAQRVYVLFTITRRGAGAVATDVKLEKESGFEQLDRSALRAVNTASLPPLPPGFTGSSVDVRFYFDYTR